MRFLEPALSDKDGGVRRQALLAYSEHVPPGSQAVTSLLLQCLDGAEHEVYIHVYVYIDIYMYVCMYVCICT